MIDLLMWEGEEVKLEIMLCVKGTMLAPSYREAGEAFQLLSSHKQARQ